MRRVSAHDSGYLASKLRSYIPLAFSHRAAIAAFMVLCYLLWQLECKGAENENRFDAISAKVTVTMEVNGMHPWTAEGSMIAGFMVVEAGFPDATRKRLDGTNIEARAEGFIPVRNLQAVGETWKPYNDQQTLRLHKKLKADEHPKIFLRLMQLSMRTTPQAAAASYQFDATGELAIAGVTNRISLPVQVAVLSGNKVKLSGHVDLKQSDFNVGYKSDRTLDSFDLDTVRVAFEWTLAQKKASELVR